MASLNIKKLEKLHVQPRTIDQKFFDDLQWDFFRSLDPRGLYFTKSDIQSDSIAISPSIIAEPNSCQWQKSLLRIFKKKISEAGKTIESILSKPFKFDKPDFINPLGYKFDFCQNKVELKKRWERWLLYETLEKMYRMNQVSTSASDPKKILAFEGDARSKVREKELVVIRNLEKSDQEIEKLISETLLKSIAKIFDPHSTYFSISEKKVFEESISSNESAFGFELAENNLGEVSVSKVIPGGPAWNSNEIHKGDLVLQVKRDGGDFVDLDEFDLDPKELIESWKENHIEIKLRKADGKISVVKLAKEKIQSIENRVQGFVLNGAKKIGYVSLPSFYMEWDDENPNSGCANDLAKEIIKLKKEGISGLILDLRYNGGGSLREAVELSGIFIDVGPVAILKSKGQAFTLKDTNRGTVYDGPLLVLVNGASASASEIVAATLQDYNRAIIAGTPTYGKATGQIVYPDSTKFGFLKITVDKLYRITGKSNQRKGVQPDVRIRDLTEEFILKESASDFALAPDSILKKTYYTPSPKYDLSKIRSTSEERIARKNWVSSLDSIKNFYRTPIPAELNAFLAYMKRAESLRKMLDSNPASTKYKVTHNQFDNSVLKMDEFLKTISDESLANISKSIYVDEAYSILIDYINQIKN